MNRTDQQQRPRCISLLLCERIIVDAKTRNRTLVDVFDAIVFDAFSGVRPRLGLFATLVRGTADQCSYGIGLYTQTGEPVFDVEGEVTDWGGGLIDMDVEVGNVTFPAPGTYFLRVFLPDEQLAERPIVVTVASPGSPSGGRQG